MNRSRNRGRGGGRRNNRNTGVSKHERRVPVSNPDRAPRPEENESREGLGEFFQEYDDGTTRLTLEGFLKIREGWALARSIFKEKDSKTSRIPDFFPSWVKNIPGLIDKLKPLTQNSHIDNDDFFDILKTEGFITKRVYFEVQNRDHLEEHPYDDPLHDEWDFENYTEGDPNPIVSEDTQQETEEDQQGTRRPRGRRRGRRRNRSRGELREGAPDKEEADKLQEKQEVNKEIERMERERIKEKEKREKIEMLKEKILENFSEIYFVPEDAQEKRVHIIHEPSSFSPNIVTTDKDAWGEEIPAWRSSPREVAVYTRYIYTKAIIVGDGDVRILDINRYGKGPDATKKFIADNPGGELISLDFYSEEKYSKQGFNSYTKKEYSLIIHDPELHLSGEKD